MAWTMHVCDVHRLVDKDNTERESMFCGRCKAWICKECRNNWAKRAQAMMLSKKEQHGAINS